MPLLSIYSLALEQDLEFSHCMVQAVGTLHTQTLMQVCGRTGRRGGRCVGCGGAAPGPPPAHTVSPQPLNLRRLEHEKRRKEIKESWHRAQRKLVRPPAGAGRGGGKRRLAAWPPAPARGWPWCHEREQARHCRLCRRESRAGRAGGSLRLS